MLTLTICFLKLWSQISLEAQGVKIYSCSLHRKEPKGVCRCCQGFVSSWESRVSRWHRRVLAEESCHCVLRGMEIICVFPIYPVINVKNLIITCHGTPIPHFPVIFLSFPVTPCALSKLSASLARPPAHDDFHSLCAQNDKNQREFLSLIFQIHER